MTPQSPPDGPIEVAILLLDSVVPFDLGVACQVFGYGRPDLGMMRYRMTICGAEPGPVMTSVGFPVVVEHGLGALRGAHTVIVPGIRSVNSPLPPQVLEALRSAHADGARIAS